MFAVPHLPKPTKGKSLAVLTSGGDAPGMNAAIRAIVRFGIAHGCQMQGIVKGYTGLLDERFVPLTLTSVSNIIQRGGTILKTDRCLKFQQKAARKKAAQILRKYQVEGLIVIGGDGSFTGASLLEEETGFPVIGIPGTIDNDIFGTEETIGFDTAVNTAVQAIDRIRDTANSYDRIFLVEVMGHNSGFLALQVGVAGGVETLVIPERQTPLDEMVKILETGKKRGKTSGIIVVAEGPQPGLAHRISQELDQSGYSTRVCILGHTQRGGPPSAHDRVLASVLGSSAVAYLLEGQSHTMVGIQDHQVVCIPLKQVIGVKKNPPDSLIQLAYTLAS